MMVYLIRTAVPKLKFNKEYRQRVPKPIPKKEPGMKEETTAEVQAQPRHPTGFLQYCMNCGKNQTFRVDALGWKTCTVSFFFLNDRAPTEISPFPLRLFFRA